MRIDIGNMDLDDFKKEKVAIIGYGIQGNAQAHNLRDSGVDVLVSNRKDSYYEQAIKDGFKVYPIEEAVKNSTINLMLIPDQSQREVFNDLIKPNIKEGSMLVVAHGYSITYNKIDCPKNIDIVLLAPRFPGRVIRENYLKGEGTLAFFDVYRDFTKTAERRGLNLSKATGLTKLLNVKLKEETHIDLFIEQFLIPSFLKTIQTGYDVLTEKGYNPEIALLELFSSGEILELLDNGRKVGMYKSFQQNTSPTCQYGVQQSFNKIITDETKKTAEKILEEIRNGDFAARLQKESEQGYLNLKAFNKKNLEGELSKVQLKLSNLIRNE